MFILRVNHFLSNFLANLVAARALINREVVAILTRLLLSTKRAYHKTYKTGFSFYVSNLSPLFQIIAM